MKAIYKIIIILFFLIIINSCARNNYDAVKIKEVRFSDLSLRDKIGQMLIIEGKEENLDDVAKLNIGGIFFFALKNEKTYKNLINKFQENSHYSLFISTDLEGCVNMLENVKKFRYFNEIETSREAYELGLEMGKLLKRLGFNLNFAPVLDLKDTIWNCRSFTGSTEEIKDKGFAFIKGLQSTGILGTIKHFPGRTLDIDDTHKIETKAIISKEDLFPFYHLENITKVIMINHLIVDGEINSSNLPSSISPKVINNIKDRGYQNLIITDDLKMRGVSERFSDKYEVYVAAINAGNDLLLNVYEKDPEKAINYIETAVKEKRINQILIDQAVRKIFKAKDITIL